VHVLSGRPGAVISRRGLNRGTGTAVGQGMSVRVDPRRPRTTPAAVALRILAAACLGVSAWIHFHLADRYATVPHDVIGQDDLFYIQAAVAAVVALWLLVTGRRFAWWAAALVGASSLGAVLLYRYVDVGALGPLPNMNDASWEPSPDKAVSAIVEAAVVVLWLIDEVRRRAGR
jgi:hypothetical protein